MNKINQNDVQINRRRFLKSTSALGSVVLTPLISPKLLADNYEEVTLCDTKENHGLPKDFIYLNSGTEGSMPRCVISDFESNLKLWASDPTASYETDAAFGKHQHMHRQQVASLFSVGKDNICLTDNTTMGLSMVLMGINFRPRDKVIYTNQEHTAITSPLALLKEKSGLDLFRRNFPPVTELRGMKSSQLVNYLLPDILSLRGAKALCISHIYPSTGVRLPLEIVRERANQLGIKYLIVDGAQAFGMIDISDGVNDIKHSDFYACPGHKWLNGPPSTGILYLKNSTISPPDFFPMLSQRMEKYSASNDIKKPLFPMAEALQVRGCSNAPGFAAMMSAVNFQKALGGSKIIETHIMALSLEVKRFIFNKSPNSLVSPNEDSLLGSGLTVFFPFSWDDPNAIYTDRTKADYVVKALLENNIQIRSIGFNDEGNNNRKVFALRISTAIFTRLDQINHFKSVLKQVLSHI